jgi:hypothetical protein
VVPRLRPVRFALTGVAVVPEPTDCCEVEVKLESVLEVPHSNHAIVGDPFGFTDPFVTAELVVTELAPIVVTDGGFAPVVKLRIASFCVPPLFCPATRK